jgi:hypothetical protein
MVLQVVATKELPAAAAAFVQLATGVGPVLTRLQVVCVKLFAALADAETQVPGATPVGPVFTGVHVVVTKLFAADAVAGEQDATGTLVVVFGVGQVIAVKLLPEPAACAVQVATGTLA